MTIRVFHSIQAMVFGAPTSGQKETRKKESGEKNFDRPIIKSNGYYHGPIIP